MANGNTTVTRPGASNLGADKTALFLTLFANMVMREFNRRNVMMGRHRVKTLTTGISHKFEYIGKASSSYHTPGEDIFDAGNSYLSNLRHGSRYIAADKILTAATTVDVLDEIINHFDVRSEYAAELARELSDTLDENVMRMLIKAARTAAGGVYTGSPGGTTIVSNTSDTDGGALLDAIRSCAQTADELNWPDEQRYFILQPAGYYLLQDNKDVIHRDYGNEGNGSLRSGKVLEAYGFELVKSNTLKALNDAGAYAATTHQLDGASGNNVNDYAVDPTDNGGGTGTVTTTGIAFQASAIGTVKKLDMNVKTEEDFDRNCWKIKAQYSMGHGILRPECAIQVVAS